MKGLRITTTVYSAMNATRFGVLVVKLNLTTTDRLVKSIKELYLKTNLI
jgi:hypothetical protein